MTAGFNGRDFGRLEGKVDEIANLLRASTLVQTHNTQRITKLETSNARRTAFVAGCSAAVSGTIAVVTHYLKIGGLF